MSDTCIEIISIDTSELDNLIDELPAILDRVGRMASEEIVADVKLDMQQSPPIGRLYKRGTIEHQASAAGFAPRPDIGTLMASIHWYKQGPLHWRVSDGVEYGYWLEVGTENIEARPFFGPVLEEWHRHKLIELMQQQLRAAI